MPDVFCHSILHPAPPWAPNVYGKPAPFRASAGLRNKGLNIPYGISTSPPSTSWDKASQSGDDRHYEVWWGDLTRLADVLPETVDLTVIDLFGKKNRVRMADTLRHWKSMIGGEVFIP